MLFDPFYGFDDERIERWLNRVVLFAEIAGFVLVIRDEVLFNWTDWDVPWNYIALTLGYLIAASLLNRILRFLEGVVLVLIYGTSDEDKIRSRWERRRALKSKARLETLPSWKETEKRISEEKRLKQSESSAKSDSFKARLENERDILRKTMR